MDEEERGLKCYAIGYATAILKRKLDQVKAEREECLVVASQVDTKSSAEFWRTKAATLHWVIRILQEEITAQEREGRYLSGGKERDHV